MREILLDGSAWKTQEDFYEGILRAVGAPEWHGHNLDALNDSIGTGGINRIEVPYPLRVCGLRAMYDEARAILERFRELIDYLKADGVEVDMVVE
jgi:RNAse (barnase) inhibitor barstar